MPPLRTGDPVIITYEGRTVSGHVILASPNGKSLMLEFEAILGGFVGMMPVLEREDGDYHDLLSGNVVKVVKRDPEG
jgi:hypothetical protein